MRGRGAFLSLVLGVWTTSVWAQALVGPEFQVESHTRTLTYDPGIASDADGNFVVVWTDFPRDGSGDGVFGRRFDVTGAPRGADFRVNSHTSNYQFRPAVASDPAGRFVVAWTSFRQDGSGYGIFAQRYDADGRPEGPEFRVNSTTWSDQYAPDIAMDTGGAFVVVWQSRSAGSGFDIMGRRYDADGAALGSEFQVNAYATGHQYGPVVAVDPSGPFIVAWESATGDGGGSGVFGQRYDAAGARLDAEFAVNTHTTSTQRRPAVAYGATGDFVIVWQSDGQDGSRWGVFGRRYDMSRQELGPEFRVNAYTTGDQASASVSFAADGSFAVVWDGKGQDGSQSGIFGRHYDASGAPRGREFRLNEFTHGDQHGQAVAAQPQGRFAAVWMSPLGSVSHGRGRIFGRRFAMPPDLLFSDGFESRSLGAWSAGATDEGDLAISGAAALRATTAGLQAVVDDPASTYVEDHTPAGENCYRARFYFDPNGFDPGEAAGHFRTRLFLALEEAPGRRVVAVVLKRQGGVYSLMAGARLDDDSHADSGFLPIADAPHAVEIDWHRASGADASDGFLHLWLDGTHVAALEDLDNSESAVDFVRLGALRVKPGASGTLFWDEFESRRESYIGP